MIRLGVGLAPLAHLIIYDLSEILQLNEFAWTIRSSVCVFFNPFLLKDATDRSKISSDQKRLFFAVSLYPLSFFANTPFKNIFPVNIMSQVYFVTSFLGSGVKRVCSDTVNMEYK